MKTEDHFEELQQEIEPINWDIAGLSETRLPGKETETLKSGHLLRKIKT